MSGSRAETRALAEISQPCHSWLTIPAPEEPEPMNQKTIVRAAGAAVLAAGMILSLAATRSVRAAEDDPPLSLARDGFFYVGGKNIAVNGRTHVVNQMYVEMRIPA